MSKSHTSQCAASTGTHYRGTTAVASVTEVGTVLEREFLNEGVGTGVDGGLSYLLGGVVEDVTCADVFGNAKRGEFTVVLEEDGHFGVEGGGGVGFYVEVVD